MKIRPVTKSDVPQIIELIGAAWAEYECVLDVEREETYLLAPGEYFRARGGEFWVAEESGAVRATIAVSMLDAKTAELKSLYVKKDFRKKGLGKALTGLAVNFAQNKAAAEIILWSDTRFTRAHRLYERLGFERCGERELNDLNNSKEFGFKKNLQFSAV